MRGEARAIGERMARRLVRAVPGTCLLMGGETTVTLRGHGRGGRNQELALSAALMLEGTQGAALLAFPTKWYKTVLGFVIGFPLIYAMNIARIAVLLVIGHHSPQYFDFLHLYFWQGTMILMVASTWLIWVLWVVRGDSGLGAPRRASP